MPYLNGTDTTAEADLERYKLLTVMAAVDVDDVEQQWPGWHAANFDAATSWLKARLAKRYAEAVRPFPQVLEGWLVDMVTLRGFLRKGVRQTDEQFQEAVRADTRARAEVLEAANSVTGLFDLPLKADVDSSGITRGGPLGTSSYSPYSWMDATATGGRADDGGRR